MNSKSFIILLIFLIIFKNVKSVTFSFKEKFIYHSNNSVYEYEDRNFINSVLINNDTPKQIHISIANINSTSYVFSFTSSNKYISPTLKIKLKDSIEDFIIISNNFEIKQYEFNDYLSPYIYHIYVDNNILIPKSKYSCNIDIINELFNKLDNFIILYFLNIITHFITHHKVI